MRRASAPAMMWLCMLWPGATLAEEGTQAAQGRFESGGVAVDVVDAYAFRTRQSYGDDPVIAVAVSNASLLEAAVDRWLDRKQFLENRVKNQETAVIYFEFSPQGGYQAVSYYLGSGNGCGYCGGGEVKSGVKLEAGRLAGPFSFKGKDRSWDITLDVPLASDDHGTALPPGGGAPGKAYLAFAAAVKDRDAFALKELLASSGMASLERAEKAGQVDAFLDFLGENRYVDTVQVLKGFAGPDRAVLAVAGEGPVGKRKGQVLLRKEAGAWRVDDEILDMASE